MTIAFPQLTVRARSQTDLTVEEMQGAITAMLRCEASDNDIADLLIALREKGESVSELVGAALALRQHMTPIESPHELLLDTCGTGGDGSGTFNISTAAAIVIAAAGVPVAKHGNRAITSRSGSADVLRLLGVKIDASRERVQQCLVELGICFCFAPALHPAMRHVSEIRRRLGVRTLFNLIGPLCNPAGATHQVLGTGDPQVQTKLAAALQRLGSIRAAVVRGSDGLDEVTLAGTTRVLEITPRTIQEHEWTAKDFGLEPIEPTEIAAADADESAQMIRLVIEGMSHGAPRNVVVANAAAGLWLAGRYSDLVEAARTAEQAIDNGSAAAILNRLGQISNR